MSYWEQAVSTVAANDSAVCLLAFASNTHNQTRLIGVRQHSTLFEFIFETCPELLANYVVGHGIQLPLQIPKCRMELRGEPKQAWHPDANRPGFTFLWSAGMKLFLLCYLVTCWCESYGTTERLIWR